MTRSATGSPNDPESGSDPALIGLIDAIVKQLDAGERVSADKYQASHPELVPQIEWLLPALEAMAVLRDPLATASESCATDASAWLSEALLDDFQVVRVIGRGAMGVVYEAVERALGRRVALKVLPTAVALDERARLRFQLGAQATALLQHPHIVAIHTIGDVQGVPYVVMPLIDGCNLAELIEALQALQRAGFVAQAVPDVPPTTLKLALELLSGGRSPGDGRTEPAGWTAPQPMGLDYARAVARLGLQAAQALQHAHEQGIVHRDIKPANLLLDRTGQLRITDFGLARLPEAQGLTRTGDLVGTIPYMSPEQTRGQPGPLDHRTDLYGLGATLYELLTLQPAMTGSDRAEVLRRIAHEEPVPLRRQNPAVPADLATIVARAMAKQPSDRYAHAGDLADDLGRFLEGRPIVARPLGALPRLYRWTRRNPALAGLAALTLALMTLLAVGGVTVALGQRAQRREADRLRSLAERRAVEADRSARQTQAARERADRELQRAIQAYEGLALRLNRLGGSHDPEVLRVRQESLQDAMAWCEQHLARVGPPAQWTVIDLEVAVLLAPLRAALGQLEPAVAISQAVREASQRLIADQPDHAELRRLQAGAMLNLMTALAASGQAEAAAVAGVEADQALAQALQRFPDNVELLRLRFGLLGNHAGTLQGLGRRQEALAADLASLPCMQAVLRQSPTRAADRIALAAREGRVGLSLLEQGRHTQALEVLDDALDQFEHLSPSDRDAEAARLHRRLALEWRARGRSESGRHAAAAHDLQTLLPLVPDPATRWQLRHWAIHETIQAGQIERALEDLRALAADPDVVRTAPLGLARLCAAILTAPAATPDERDRAAALALSWLETIGRNGLLSTPEHRDPLRHSPEFGPLRDRPEFRPIFDRLATLPVDP